MQAAFCVVAFFLGALISNYFKSNKIKVLTQEAQSAQTRFYELQNSSKKQLSENATVIKQLRSEKSQQKVGLISSKDTSHRDSKLLKTLKEKNSSLEKELLSIKAKNKELKVEQAVKKVEKKYPMQLYGMDGVSPDATSKKEAIDKKKKSSVKKLKPKKVKSKIVLHDEKHDNNKLKAEVTVDQEKSKLKGKKSKKKSKSKKRKSKKVLALFKSGKKGKKSKKSKKKKKHKSKGK